jgi:DNA-binding NarL/FixJ family response regulator
LIIENTLERHLENIYSRLEISGRISAAVYAVRNRLVG